MSESMNVVKKYFDKNSLVKHQIDSFNKFVRYDISKIIKDTGDIICSVNGNKCEIKFFNFSLGYINHVENDGTEMNITPHECRLRNISYTAPMFIDISVNDHLFEQCDIGRLPIMVKSDYCLLKNIEKTKECENDPGGYFIVSGTEKVIVSQEKMNNNQVYVFEKKSNKIEYEAEIRSVKENETVKGLIEACGDDKTALRTRLHHYAKAEIGKGNKELAMSVLYFSDKF